MKLNQIQERINKLLSFFVTEVKGATAMGRVDINHVSEVVLVPLLSKVFGYPNLANLNHAEHANYPGIDLGDSVASVAFQITSTSGSEKVKDALTKFVRHELYKKYDRLIIYILTEKQDSYSGKGFEDIIQGKFKFDKDRDIIDYSDLLKVISSLQIDKAQEIERILESNLGGDNFSLLETFGQAARRAELLDKYLQYIKAKVSKVRILGDTTPHDLTDVFVELTVLRDRERPSSQTQIEHWGMMDAELRKRRNPLINFDQAEDEQNWAAKRKARPEELLKAGTRAAIAGVPGGGKSTLLKSLALGVLRDGDYLPLLLELNTVSEADFAAAEGSLPELVFEKALAAVVRVTESDRTILRNEFYKKLKDGRVAIFLDGLDEVSGTDFFDDLRLSVREFLRHAQYKDNTLFISTRPYALLDQFSAEDAQEFEIAPFSPEQVERFIGHYFGDDPQAADFLVELRGRPDLRELASVPALLGFMFILFSKNHGRVPEDRLELYREVVQKLASEWDKEKPARREFQTTDARRIDFLAHLAFTRLFTAPERPLSRRFIFTGQDIFGEAEDYCRSKGIPEQTDALADEVKETALIRQVGTDAYAFAHLTLQELMAATALSKHDDRKKILCRAYFDPTLCEMEVLPMMLGLAGHQPELYDALEALPESLDHKKLRLRVRSLAYGQPPDQLLLVLGNTLDEFVRGEGEIEDGYFDLVVRAYGAASGAAGEAIARRVASRLDKDEHEYVRGRAVRASGIINNETAVDTLRQALKDADASVRVEAASLLGLKDEKKALEVLTEELQSGDEDVKDEVINALWNLGTDGAVEALEEAVVKYPKARKRALEALAGIRGEAAVPILAGHLNDPDDWVRRTVVESLGEIGVKSVIPELIRAVDDDKTDVAEKAVEFLGRIGGVEIIKYLTGSLANRSGTLLGKVAEALGQAGAVEAIPKLAQLLDEYKEEVPAEDFLDFISGGWIKGVIRAKVAGALCQLGDEQGHAALVEIIAGDDSENKKYAAKALGRCRPDEAKTLLPEAISKIPDTYDLAKYHIVALAKVLYELEACDDQRVVNAMLNVLSSSRGSRLDSLTSVAINVLWQAGGPRAVEALTKALEHSDPTMKLSAVVGLSNIADENTVPGLLIGLTCGWGIVTPYAARGLARVEGAALYQGLKLSARSKYPKVRLKVARNLFYYSHDEQAVEIMSELAAKDPREKIKDAARLALSQLEHKKELYT